MSSRVFQNCATALLDSLDQVCKKIETPVEDHLFLIQLLQNKNLNSLITVHNKINNQNVPPSYQDASRLTKDVQLLCSTIPLPESKELSLLLSNPHLKALLLAHDQIARKDFLPVLPDVPFFVDEDDASVKVVQLIKNKEPLGATIKIDEASDAVVVSRIVGGSVADRSGLINVGDELREVNGVRVKGKSPLDILAMLQCREGTITFTLVPGVPTKQTVCDQIRANFSYDPYADPSNPNPDLSLSFERGDVLHIVSRQNLDWWQAHLDKDIKIGLIPSPDAQRRKLSLQNNLSETETPIETFDPYEEVALLHLQPGFYRPIVLLGAPGVGRNELKQRLMAHDPQHYKTCIPHTSRPPKSWEEEGKEYYFVSRETMEEGIQSGKFVEYGEYHGNLYGTSMDSIFSIVRSGCVCLLNPHPQALKLLCNAELKPFVIFIQPPPLEVLRATRNSHIFNEQELKEITDYSQRIERTYGPRIDATLVNDNIDRSFKELLSLVKMVETEPQWSPAVWC